MAHGNGTLPMAWIYFPATRMQACMPCLVVILQPGSPSWSPASQRFRHPQLSAWPCNNTP